MQNRKAEAAVTARLVGTEDTPATFRARLAETGASNQPRAHADQLAKDGAREHTDDTFTVDRAQLIAALPAAIDEAMRKAIPSKYTPELASELANDMAARLTGTKCTAYEDCTDTNPGHYDHYSRFAIDDDPNGSALIDAGMVHNSGSDQGAIVYLRDAEFTDTTVLRAKTSKVRHLLERAERMGDRVLGVDARALDSIDERIKNDVAGLVSLIAYRRRSASDPDPSESGLQDRAEQESAAAFDLATRALDTALAVTPGQADTFTANLATFNSRIRNLSRTARGLSEDGLLAPAQTTLVLDEGLGALRTTPVETELRDIDCERDPHCVHTPFLAAEVVVSEYRSQAYGRTTRVWLHQGSITGELSPAEAREALEAMRGFIPQLEAVIALAEQEAGGDFEGDPEIARLDDEAERRRTAAISAARR